VPRLLLLHARSDAACHVKWGQRYFVCILPHVQTDALLHRRGPATCRGCFCCMHVLMLHAMSSGAGGIMCASRCAVASRTGNVPRLLLLHACSDAACHIKWGQRFFLCISPHVQTDALLRQGPATCRGCFCCMHVLMLHAISSWASSILCAFRRMYEMLRCSIVRGRQRAEAAPVACTF